MDFKILNFSHFQFLVGEVPHTALNDDEREISKKSVRKKKAEGKLVNRRGEVKYAKNTFCKFDFPQKCLFSMQAKMRYKKS